MPIQYPVRRGRFNLRTPRTFSATASILLPDGPGGVVEGEVDEVEEEDEGEEEEEEEEDASNVPEFQG